MNKIFDNGFTEIYAFPGTEMTRFEIHKYGCVEGSFSLYASDYRELAAALIAQADEIDRLEDKLYADAKQVLDAMEPESK